MLIRIIPFFSSISSKEMQKRILSHLGVKETQIISPEQFISESIQKGALDQFFLFVGTGGTEKNIATFVEQSSLGPSLVLISYDLSNSLPAAMEARTYLQQQGYSTRIIHGKLEELSSIIQKLEKYLSIREKIAHSRIGIIGVPSDWLIASKVNEEAIKRIWGTDLLQIPMSELLNLKEGSDNRTTSAFSESLIQQATEILIPKEAILNAEAVVNRIEHLVQAWQLDAVTVECFSLVQSTDITSCLALSYLNDKNKVAGCEGDIPSTFTMFLLHLLTQQPVFMANVIHVEEKTNRMTLAHCTVPITMLETFSLTTHFETDKSVAVKGRFKVPQKVTILKMGGEDLTQRWVAKGKIVENPSNQMACRTQIKILVLDKPVNYFLENSIANHHCVVLGDYVEEIQEFFRFTLEF